MAAAVVVANPVAPPVRDLQISTTQLSTSPEALIPFDKNLLKSISQPSPASSFSAALAQILGALAAEADRIGTEVNSNTGTPLTPATAGATPLFAPLPVGVATGAVPNGTPSTSTTVVAAEATAASPIMQQVFSAVTEDTAYLGNKVVEAAYAAVTAIVSTPNLIFAAVKAVLIGDLTGAFATIVQAIKAFFDPGLILVGGIDDVVGQYAPPPTNSNQRASSAAANGHVAAPPATAARQGTSKTESDNEKVSGTPRRANPGSARHATTDPQPELTPSSSASAPASGNASRSAEPAVSDSADQPKQKAAGADKPGAASSGRSQNAGGRGPSADN